MMKKNVYPPLVKFLTIASGLFLFLTSCQEVDYEITSTTGETKAEIPVSNVIDFNGLTVNHRFRTPVEDLEIELTETGLKQMYTKITNQQLLLSKTTVSDGLLELPDTDLIIEATKQVVDLFPYSSEREPIFIKSDEQKYLDTVSVEIREYILKNNLFDLSKDSLRLIEHEKNATELNTQQEKRKWEMIQNDFIGISDEQIEENIELIDEYYKKNMNYEILLTTKEKKEELTANIARKTDYESENPLHITCVLNLSGTLANSLNIQYAGDDARGLADEEYPSLGGGDDRRDAFRHMMWNVLLAKYYFTLSTSRYTRTNFATRVTSAWETCGDNEDDGKAMDIHNNVIGRDIYLDNTGTKTILWGSVQVGVSEATTNTYAADAKDRVENNSIYFVKNYSSTLFPEKYLGSVDNDKDASYIKNKIEASDAGTVVYFTGPIAPNYSIRCPYDYSTCTNADQPWTTTTTVINLPPPFWPQFGGSTYTSTTYSPCINKYELNSFEL